MSNDKIIDTDFLLFSISEAFKAKRRFKFTPSGKSMLPLIDGKTDTVTLKTPDDVKIGDIILYTNRNGKLLLHRAVGLYKNCYITNGDNVSHIEYPIDKSAVIAVADEINNQFGCIRRGDKKYGCKSIFHRFSVTLRILKLKIKNPQQK